MTDINKYFPGTIINEKTVSNKQDTNVTFKLPDLEGDCSIMLGQTIVTLIRLNLENDNIYSKNMQQGFKIELMNSILEELGVTIEDLRKLRQRYEQLKSDNQ